MALFSAAPKSLCFLRLSAIGDICHALAVVQSVQRYWPSTKITWIVGKVEATLLQDLEGVEIVVFDKKAGWQGIRSTWQALSNQRFDALIHMQLALRSSLLSLGIKAKYKVGFHRNRAKEGQWLFTNRKIPDTQSQHVLDSFYAFIEYLGVPKEPPQWQLPISQQDKQYASSILQGEPTVAISPAASKDERNWLIEGYAEFADWVVKQGYQVVICGSPSEREKQLALKIQQSMKTSCTNIVGQTTLKQLAAILQQADVLLAPDSGPAHLATTQNTPVIGLYGHSNPKRTGPYYSQQYVVSVYEKFVQQQYNKPLEQLSWSTRVKGDHIMRDIELIEVKRVFTSIVSNEQ